MNEFCAMEYSNCLQHLYLLSRVPVSLETTRFFYQLNAYHFQVGAAGSSGNDPDTVFQFFVQTL